MCGESWHAIKDLQPTAPVLKAGHPVSCSTRCMLCVVCLECRYCLVRVLGFLLLFLMLLGYCAIHTFLHVHVHVPCSTAGVSVVSTFLLEIHVKQMVVGSNPTRGSYFFL